MKKITLLTAVCFAALSLVAQDLVIPKMQGAPVIDGTIDPVWDLIDQVDLEVEQDPLEEGYFGPPTIFEAWFKMAWNDETLFLLIRRDDNEFADQWETNLADWQSDRDEIFIDVNVDTLADGRGASNEQEGPSSLGADYGHYQFTSIWQQDQTTWTGNPNQWYHNAPYTLGYTFDTDNSYYAEYAFPFSSLTIDTDLLPHADETFQGTEGVIFGLQISMTDVDMIDNPTDETFRKHLMWIENGGGWTEMDTAGQVELGSEVVSGIEESLSGGNIFAYPSPATNYLMIGNLIHPATVEIYDVAGRLMIVQNDVANDTRIDLNLMPAGVYFLRIGNETTIKFLIE